MRSLLLSVLLSASLGIVAATLAALGIVAAAGPEDISDQATILTVYGEG